MPEKHRVFLKKHCLECHDAETQEGKMNLEDLSFQITTIQDAERWQKVLNSLNAGAMPPEDEPQPENSSKADFLDDLARTMVTARSVLSDSGGTVAMRRLNQREYRNTIRALLGVEVNASELPADGGAGTFDTVGSSLFMSSDQIEQYLALGRRALDDSFARYVKPAQPAVAPPKIWKQRREVELHANRKVGGTYNGYYTRGYKVAKAYLDSDRSQPPSTFGKGIADEAEAKFRVKVFKENGPSFERYLKHPLTKTGAFLTISNVNNEEYFALPPEHPTGWRKTKHVVETLPSGDYMLRFRIGAVERTPSNRHFVSFGSVPHEKEFILLETFQITGTIQKPQTIEIPISLTADGPRKFAIREKRDVKLDRKRFIATRKKTGFGPTPALWIDWVEWEGPLAPTNKNSLTKNLFARAAGKSEADQARQIIADFATKAFRDARPENSYLDRLVSIFEERRAAGADFHDALKEPLSVVLASPGFLYLSEPGQETKPKQLTDRELAVRLSYFLWSAPPDDILLELARRGELHKPAVLAAQVDRLIADPRSYEFVTGFTHQWLNLERLDFFQFNTQLYPEFDDSMKATAKEEVFRSIEHLLNSGGSLRELLKSDYIIINGLLANYYDINGVVGDEFRKVSLPADSPRGGLLGMAAILAMGSNGEHTSPVERGAWVLRKLLHDPPPPAPPNVPQLTRLGGKLLTTRERILAHQEEPQCASCHRKIDPIGFGLENFNAVGKWRTKDSYQKRGVGKKEWNIDPSGALHKGPAFANYFELRDLIASREEQFARGFTEALIEYALGRPFGFTDEELAERMVANAKAKQFNVRQFFHELVASPEFQRK